MIERKFVSERIKELEVKNFVRDHMKGVGLSDIKVQKTPLGEKIIIFTSRPGLVVGRKGQNIKELTRTLKKEFSLENPQIEIGEVDRPELNANIIAERIVEFLEKFGTTKFKGIGHKVMTDVMNSGAAGIELVISGKIPSARAKSWRFYQGYLKKCGDTALTSVNVAYAAAKLKSGIVGVKVSIMPLQAALANRLEMKAEQVPEQTVQPKAQETSEAPSGEKAQ
ncbi:30S ribosomal protein S3 [Candidatus Woesearchaeota archaeon]|nr:30S ribosomal protein S3 [Candidatus Woesearchaeota archaeon]